MTAIFKREFRSYFHTVLGWLFVAVTLFFLSLYFFVYNLLQGYPYFGYTIQSVIFLYVITIPILTMRIFAEEKKNKTDQMLYTAPVSVFIPTGMPVSVTMDSPAERSFLSLSVRYTVRSPSEMISSL